MSYKVVLTERFTKKFEKLDHYTQLMISKWIMKNLNNCDNPRLHGKALVGNKKGFWRYRIGDYRIIASINDKELIIYAMEIGHRKEIYK